MSVSSREVVWVFRFVLLFFDGGAEEFGRGWWHGPLGVNVDGLASSIIVPVELFVFDFTRAHARQ